MFSSGAAEDLPKNTPAEKEEGREDKRESCSSCFQFRNLPPFPAGCTTVLYISLLFPWKQTLAPPLFTSFSFFPFSQFGRAYKLAPGEEGKKRGKRKERREWNKFEREKRKIKQCSQTHLFAGEPKPASTSLEKTAKNNKIQSSFSTHWHSLTPVQGVDGCLGLLLAAQLHEGATWKERRIKT